MNKELTILTERYLYTARTTIGRMCFEYFKDFVQDPPVKLKEYFGFTLEDTARPGNIKVYSETCLPGDLECLVSLFENQHYGKTIIFHTEPDGVTIIFGELKWTGCLAHNGINFDHTAGCVLVGSILHLPVYDANKKIISEPNIEGGLKDKLRLFIEQKMSEGYTIKARFINLTQKM